ncbi:MAG: arginine--tRNA ligase [Pseudomonadales bacterium]
MNIRQSLEQQLALAMTKAGIDQPSPMIRQSQRAAFGHYQANGVMSAAKRLQMDPRTLAQNVVAALAEQPDFTAEIAGPGFINITLTDHYLADALSKQSSSAKPVIEKSERVVVDYSSPNLAKEMHIGHLRSTVIGDTVVRVLEHVGHTPIRANHVGDWGAQFGSLLAYLDESNAATESAELSDLEAFYQVASKRFKEDTAFAEKAREYVVRLQAGDPELKTLWQTFINTSMEHGQRVYDLLNITLTRDHAMPESQYNDDLQPLVADLTRLGLIEKSDGALCVFLDEFKGKNDQPLPAMVQKTDGGFPYLATDLAALRYRHNTLKANRILYVVGASQQLHLKQVIAVARAAAFIPDEVITEHLPFGLVLKDDGKPFKTRDGADVKLIDVALEAVDRAKRLLTARSEDLSEQDSQRIAEVVGVGAIKYAELQKNRTTDYIFDWETMLAFEGNTAPYLLYAYTRIQSLIRKSSITMTNEGASFNLSAPQELALALKNLQMSEALDSYLDDYQANILCNYLYELAGLFMSFYEHCPVLSAPEAIQKSRLRLARMTANTLKTGLNLLGIETVERM